MPGAILPRLEANCFDASAATSRTKPALPPPPDLPRYFTIEQTAARLGYSYQSISMFIQEGRLPVIDIALQLGKTRALYRIREDATLAPKIINTFS